MTLHCARCHRALVKPPVIVDGHGFGPSCARKVKEPDLVAQAAKRKRVMTKTRKVTRDERQLQLEAA